PPSASREKARRVFCRRRTASNPRCSAFSGASWTRREPGWIEQRRAKPQAAQKTLLAAGKRILHSSRAGGRSPLGKLRLSRVSLLDFLRGDRHRSEEHTSELQSRGHLVCRLLLE